jgi:hypothetical protein
VKTINISERAELEPILVANPAYEKNQMLDYIKIDNCIRRIMEISDELHAIGKFFFENSHIFVNGSTHETLAPSINELKIPGFRALHLAQEGISLLNLTSVIIATDRASEEYDDEIKLLGVLEPLFLKTIEDMEIFKNLKTEEIICT